MSIVGCFCQLLQNVCDIICRVFVILFYPYFVSDKQKICLTWQMFMVMLAQIIATNEKRQQNCIQFAILYSLMLIMECAHFVFPFTQDVVPIASFDAFRALKAFNYSICSTIYKICALIIYYMLSTGKI